MESSPRLNGDHVMNVTLPENVLRIISLYHRGIVCPAEAWNQIADAIDSASKAELEATIPADTVALIEQCKSERPLSFKDVSNARRNFCNFMQIVLYGDA